MIKIIMEKKLDPQDLVLEPGSRVTLPLTLNVPPVPGQHYTVNVQIRVTTAHAVNLPTEWTPVAREGMPAYEIAAEWGVRALRDAARDRALAPHRQVGSMSRMELLELLYRPAAPEPTASVSVGRGLPDNTAPAEKVEQKERPRRLARRPYARVNSGKVLHLVTCPVVRRSRDKDRPIEELTPAAARRLQVVGVCGSCKAELEQ